mmetsp:Transcript_13526/g.40875  ORF Transcript_13526/g.40875 Transcript_13526/m.40875 type:complete len:201 (-) Transcript_13526:31-633(-)
MPQRSNPTLCAPSSRALRQTTVPWWTWAYGSAPSTHRTSRPCWTMCRAWKSGGILLSRALSSRARSIRLLWRRASASSTAWASVRAVSETCSKARTIACVTPLRRSFCEISSVNWTESTPWNQPRTGRLRLTAAAGDEPTHGALHACRRLQAYLYRTPSTTAAYLRVRLSVTLLGRAPTRTHPPGARTRTHPRSEQQGGT